MDRHLTKSIKQASKQAREICRKKRRKRSRRLMLASLVARKRPEVREFVSVVSHPFLICDYHLSSRTEEFGWRKRSSINCTRQVFSFAVMSCISAKVDEIRGQRSFIVFLPRHVTSAHEFISVSAICHLVALSQAIPKYPSLLNVVGGDRKLSRLRG